MEEIITSNNNLFKKNNTERINFFPTEIKELTPFESKQFILNKKRSKKIKIMTKQERLERKLIKTKATKEEWKAYRKSAGKIWVDPTLNEWKEDDYRIFVGDLGNEVSDEKLRNAFMKYPSLLKAKVIRDSRNMKSKGFGFVSFDNPDDYIKAMKEMDGKYIGNRPIKLERSKWKDRSVKYSKSKLKNWKFIKPTNKNDKSVTQDQQQIQIQQ
jgi:RNA recognition motif-containing protein